MGNNIDFHYLFGFPTTFKCPECSKKITNLLEEWDIDCNTLHDKDYWLLNVECLKCNSTFDIKIKTSYKFLINEKELKENLKCGECDGELESEEEINFGQCDKCCARKYRGASR